MKNKLGKILLSAAFLIVAVLLPETDFWKYPKLAFYLLSYFLVGAEILLKAAQSIGSKEFFNEFLLMSIATIGAIAMGEYPEASAVMLFYQVGEYFQDLAVDQSRRSIRALVDRIPDSAHLEENGELSTVDPAEVEIGRVIVVKPGEKIPLDGQIVEGASEVDTASITGESVPTSVSAGDAVQSGCINLNGLLRVKVTKDFDHSSAVRILELVEDATERKAKTERFITRFSAIYTPLVVFSALLLFFIPVLFFGGQVETWLYRALSFLVVSCPCALVISVPLGFFAGIASASKMGVLIKGAEFLEVLSHVKQVVFDKTGTLTDGAFHVHKTVLAETVQSQLTAEGLTEQEFWALVAGAEQNSNHPIAQSIVSYFRAEKGGESELPKADQVEDFPGLGIVAQVKGKTLSVGNRGLCEQESLADPDRLLENEEIGTKVFVGFEGQVAALLLIQDTVRESGEAAFDGLRAMGVSKFTILSGDRAEAVRQVAGKLSVEEVYAELLPEDKLQILEGKLQAIDKNSEQTKLAFVGDGINDAPALAMADVGIAMGGLGQDAAMEAGDIVLLEDSLEKLPRIIALGQRTMRIVRQNIVFALGVKCIILLLSALGITGMWMAVVGDVGVSILAILNSMRNLSVIDKN